MPFHRHSDEWTVNLFCIIQLLFYSWWQIRHSNKLMITILLLQLILVRMGLLHHTMPLKWCQTLMLSAVPVRAIIVLVCCATALICVMIKPAYSAPSMSQMAMPLDSQDTAAIFLVRLFFCEKISYLIALISLLLHIFTHFRV